MRERIESSMVVRVPAKIWPPKPLRESIRLDAEES
jgi:hypothetical protein